MIKDEATQISRFPQLWQTIRLVYQGICMATITEPDYCPLSVVHEFLDDLWPFIFNNYNGKNLLILLDAYQKTSQLKWCSYAMDQTGSKWSLGRR